MLVIFTFSESSGWLRIQKTSETVSYLNSINVKLVFFKFVWNSSPVAKNKNKRKHCQEINLTEYSWEKFSAFHSTLKGRAEAENTSTLHVTGHARVIIVLQVHYKMLLKNIQKRKWVQNEAARLLTVQKNWSYGLLWAQLLVLLIAFYWAATICKNSPSEDAFVIRCPFGGTCNHYSVFLKTYILLARSLKMTCLLNYCLILLVLFYIGHFQGCLQGVVKEVKRKAMKTQLMF